LAGRPGYFVDNFEVAVQIFLEKDLLPIIPEELEA